MSYRLIEDLQEKAITVSQACRTLEVSRSGYYAAAKRRSTAPVVCAASVHLRAAFAASGRTRSDDSDLNGSSVQPFAT
ncbi:hypothetical protein [Rhodoferax sp.]|uniref:hypothetical protein n=1 Tax=Rhodoferax sp. TaxID=50421 RepID=UPI0025F7DFBA|nr:hypothetical protein [Rhodoferax sp.]